MSLENPTLEKIRAALQPLYPTRLDLRDDSHHHTGHVGAQSGGGHFHLTIQANTLTGLPRVSQHRKIYACLKGLMPQAIHALEIEVLEVIETSS